MNVKQYFIIPLLCAIFAGCDPSLKDGLVAYYPMNGNADDYSGNGNHGTVVGAVLTRDRFGTSDSAYEFHDFKYISVTNSLSLMSVTNAITVSAWVRATDYPGGWGVILCKRQDARYPRHFGFAIGKGKKGKLVIEDLHKEQTDFNSAIIGTGYPAENEWHHVAMTADGTNAVAYIDGKKVGENKTTWKPVLNTHMLLIGKDPPDNCEYFHGDLDDIAIWNRALSEKEVAVLATKSIKLQ